MLNKRSNSHKGDILRPRKLGRIPKKITTIHSRARTPAENALFEHLFESSPDAIFLVDLLGRIVLANRRVEELFGYPRSQLSGQPVEMLAPEALHGAINNAAPLDEKQVTYLELQARRKDGSLFPAEVTLNRLHSGSEAFLLVEVRGTSQRAHREQELLAQSRLVRLLQEIAVAANETDSIHDAFQFAVDRLTQYLGWPVGHAFLTEEDQALNPTAIWSGNLDEKFAEFKQISDEIRIKPGMGLPGLVLETAQPAWLNDLYNNPRFVRGPQAKAAGLNTGLAIPVLVGKEVAGVLEFFHQETIPPDPNLMAVLPHIGIQLGRVIERKQAEESLRRSALQLRMVLTSLPVLLWVMDRTGKLVMLEGKTVSEYGLKPGELVGTNVFERGISSPEVEQAIRRALEGSEIHTEIQAQSGEYFEVYFMPYYDVNWAVDGVVGLAFDITPRKRMMAELDEMQHLLLESADTERMRLASQLHDGPLQDLYGAFYQIQEIRARLDEEGQEAAARVLQVIQGVNATLRVICGELHPDTLIHLGLQKAIRSHAERLQERHENLVLHLDLAEDGLTLPHGLRLGLYRVYQQLADNVVTHAEAHHIWIRLALQASKVMLEVQDNGKGFEVPAHWIDLVRQGKLGLAGAMERVQGMKGEMTITSEAGKGTLVRVIVPR